MQTGTTDAAAPVNTKPVMHQSQLSMLSKCGLQYEFRYVKGVLAPPGIALHIGTGTHAGANANMRSKIETGKLLPIGAVQEEAKKGFIAAWDKDGCKLEAEEKILGVENVKGAALDMVVRLAALHATELAPKLNPAKTEETWRLELKGYPVDLVGTTDLKEVNKKVRDLKTSGKSPDKTDAEDSEQLTMYALAERTLAGEKGDVQVALDVLVKTKIPKVVTLESYRTDDDFREVLERVGRAARVIETGAFFPADPQSWWCSAKWCGYYDRCPHGARQRKSVAM
jgi:hypothetical protein